MVELGVLRTSLALGVAAAALSACSGPSPAIPVSGTLVGHLRQVGGPPPGIDRPVPGTMTITGPVTKQIHVGSDGAYSVELPPGSYTLMGHSPTTLVDDTQQDCPGLASAQVKVSATTTADAVCSIS